MRRAVAERPGHVEVLLSGEELLNKFQQVGPATAGLANCGLK
jgi:hypothetical protein